MNEAQTKAAPTDWWTDTLECWQRLPNKAFFFTLLTAWLLLFQFWGNAILGYVHTSSMFSWLYDAYTVGGEQNDASYGKLIPFLVVGLFWWKRKELLALPLQLWWPGLLLLAAALVLHIIGYLIQQPIPSIISLFMGIYALMGLAWGPAWLRRSQYPFFLFVFSIPLTSHLNFILFPMRLLVTWLVEMVAHLIGIGVLRQGTQLLDPSGAYGYEVAAACGGMRSLIAVFLLATVVAFGLLRSPGNRIILIILAAPLAILGNMLRLLAIIFAAEMGGQEWGNWVHEGCPFQIPFFHDPIALANLLPYVPGFVGLLWVGFWLEKREAKNKSAEGERA
jgi:exosortase